MAAARGRDPGRYLVEVVLFEDIDGRDTSAAGDQQPGITRARAA